MKKHKQISQQRSTFIRLREILFHTFCYIGLPKEVSPNKMRKNIKILFLLRESIIYNVDKNEEA